jgi:hypothetical protein
MKSASLYAGLFVLMVSFHAFGQGTSTQTTMDLLKQLQSSDFQKREKAFEILSRNPAVFRTLATSAALVDLLIRENEEIESAHGASGGAAGMPEKYGEGYSEYYAQVLGAVDQIGDKRNPKVVAALANGSYNGDSEFIKKLAKEHGMEALPVILEMCKSGITPRRMQAQESLGTFALNMPSPTASTLATIRTAVLYGLADKSMAVRQNAVKDLGIIGTRDDIPLLRRVADEDPGVLLPDKKTRRYFVRETAQKSIADINRRFPQH